MGSVWWEYVMGVCVVGSVCGRERVMGSVCGRECVQWGVCDGEYVMGACDGSVCVVGSV